QFAQEATRTGTEPARLRNSFPRSKRKFQPRHCPRKGRVP
ncbi:uncharacterized protein METZ01_LOCUS311165, partial [marine metagenome]